MIWMKRSVLCAALVLLALALLSGCPPTKPSGGTPGATKEEDEEKPPHGGQLYAAPDEKFHIELVRDKKEGKAEAYIYDSHVRKAVSTPAPEITLTIKGTPPKTVTFKPEPQASDPMGQSSHFVAKDTVFSGD